MNRCVVSPILPKKRHHKAVPSFYRSKHELSQQNCIYLCFSQTGNFPCYAIRSTILFGSDASDASYTIFAYRFGLFWKRRGLLNRLKTFEGISNHKNHSTASSLTTGDHDLSLVPRNLWCRKKKKNFKVFPRCKEELNSNY